MIFQDPLTSLNPVFQIGFQLSEVFRYHKGLNRIKSLQESIRMLRTTEIPSPEMRVGSYPHEMSGGMRQRAMIAMALACEPLLLIADEPTTALDVTVQAQVLKLIKEVCHERQTAVLLITHDMGVIAKMCQRVAVMYAGQLVEHADVFKLCRKPAHPYTRGLLRSLPRLGSKRNRLDSIEGHPPLLSQLSDGCSFEPRCGYANAECRKNPPHLVPVGEGRVAAVFLWLWRVTGLRWLSRATGLTRLVPFIGRLDALAPDLGFGEVTSSLPAGARAEGTSRGRVALVGGCVQRVFFPGVNEATLRVLSAEGYDVVVPLGQGCCGALSVHAGRDDEARAMTRDLVERLEASGAGTFLVNAAGCGSHLKRPGAPLPGRPGLARPRRRFFT